MTKVLPVVLVAVTALITTAIVEAFYALYYLWQAAFGSTPPPYDWTGPLSISGIATTAVLLAGVFAQRLLAGRSTEMVPGQDIRPATEAETAAAEAICTPD